MVGFCHKVWQGSPHASDDKSTLMRPCSALAPLAHTNTRPMGVGSTLWLMLTSADMGTWLA